MRIPITLSIYMAKQFFASVGLVFAVFAVIIILIDAAEILRRSYNYDIPPFAMIQLIFFKFPLAAQKIIPFVVLVASVLSLSKLTNNQELIIARAAGVSVWQFLAPIVVIAFLIGIFMMTLFNPLSSAMLSKYENLEGKHLRGQISSLAISSSGLWLRQKNDSSPGKGHKGESIIHALGAGQEDGELHDVTIFIYEEQDKFIQRIDAKRAKLENDFWQLNDVVITSPGTPSQKIGEYFLETELTIEQIHDSFAAPETISFWALPGFIDTLKEAGFSALRHRMHWHNILVSPFFYATMVLIGAMFSLRPPRWSKTGLLISASIIMGFTIYFLTDLVSALGLSGKLPLLIAAWVPVCITGLLGMGTILHLEES